MTLTAQIETLIDKVDTFELVKSQIAAILKVELTQQQVLATAAGQDPTLWKLRVFQTRSNPWEEWTELDDADANRRKDKSPIVNVGFDSATFPKAKGDVVERQQADGIFNIDCFAYGVSRPDGFTGHVPGDQDASDVCDRAVRLVRNILMASQYVDLGLGNTVSMRWPDQIQYYQPGIDGVAVERVQAARWTFAVSYNEFSPQYVPVQLREINVTVKRAGTGEVLLVADYQTP